jgi:hypothetical protein
MSIFSLSRSRPSSKPGSRRWGTVALVSLLLSGFAAVVAAQPAAAADPPLPQKTLTRTSWAYTDLANPLHSKVNATGDAPVGAWADRTGLHVSRSYFTLDLTGLRGEHLISAALSVHETQAAVCDHRAVEVWTTAPVTGKSSWVNPPAEQSRLAAVGKPSSGCPADLTNIDVAAAVTKAVQAGQATLTLELRVPAAHELDPSYGRRFAPSPAVLTTYNTPPSVPTNLKTTPGGACATTSPGAFVPAYAITGFYADAADADPGQTLTAQWSVWSVDDPTLRRDVDSPVENGQSYEQFDNPGLPSDRTYAWRLRVTDGTDTSDWTPTCYFTPDSIAPAVPVASSDLYLTGDQWNPVGGLGVPGKFTFSPSGSTDVVKYDYMFRNISQDNTEVDWTSAAADSIGGTATITFAPRDTGLYEVVLRSADSAGNYSYNNDQLFTVRDIRPYVWSTLYPNTTTNPDGNVGVPGVFELSPGLTDVVSYTYRLENGPSETVDADADGKAQVTLAPTHGGPNVLYVRNTDKSGQTSTDREYQFSVDTAPVITGDGRSPLVGSPSSFTLTPRLAGTTSYVYWFSDNQGQQVGDKITLPAEPDGTGKFTWTPKTSAELGLNVQSIDGAGTISVARYQLMYVDGAAPAITMTGDGSPGVPRTFTFRSSMQNITAYVYSFEPDRSDLTTVPALPDGTATITWAPPKGGNFWASVQARNADGILSDTGSQYFFVNDTPVVTSAEFHSSGTSARLPGTFQLTPRLPGTVEYQYSLDGVDGTIPAGTGGAASLPFTPPEDGYYYLQVRSRTADGTLSGYALYSFQISSAPLASSPQYPENGFSGGPGIPGTFTFTPRSAGVTAYVYQFLDSSSGDPAPAVTVPAGPDGTAVVTFTPTHEGDYGISVQAKSADGALTPATAYNFAVQ